MKQLPNEKTLMSSNQDRIILTNYRVLMQNKSWGKYYFISIFLENISSIEVKYKSNIILLIMGILLILGSIVMNEYNFFPLLAGIGVGGVFFLLWWLSKKHVIKISSNGGNSLDFYVERMNDDEIEDFLLTVQDAKLKIVNEKYR